LTHFLSSPQFLAAPKLGAAVTSPRTIFSADRRYLRLLIERFCSFCLSEGKQFLPLSSQCYDVRERPGMSEKIRKSEVEWRKILTPQQYHVTRQKGTEPPGTGEYEDTEEPGTYVCVCCGQPLFSSETKFHSGSGWPSFYAPVDEEKVEIDRDTTHGMTREEVLCSRCDAHLGHVFPDGPRPTGQRYCINSASIKLVEKDE
jgi:peptide-methionine (R)-S-oxide reductase